MAEGRSADRTPVRDGMILPKTKPKKSIKPNEILVAGETGVPYRLANCCKPALPNPIVAYVTRGNAVSIHLQNCKILSSAEHERTIEASWGSETNLHHYPVKILLKAKDRVGLIRDIAQAITSYNVNILEFGTVVRMDKEIAREIVLEVSSNEQFTAVLASLQRVRNVLKVEKAPDLLVKAVPATV